MPPSLQEHQYAVQARSPSVQSRWLSWGSKGVLTLTDQGLIGGSNFLIAILLARQLSASQYGSYALRFEGFMVTSMAYSCLILEPMLVFGSSTHRDNFHKYFGVLLWMHLAVILATSIALGGAAWLVYEIGQSPSLSKALTGAMLAVPCELFFWLVRRAFYVKLEPKAAVVGGVLYSAVLLGGISVLYNLRLLSPFLAFLLTAAGALAASFLLLGRLKPLTVSRPTAHTLGEVRSMHWNYGRWALAAALTSWISGNIYYILLGSIRGLADIGALKALMNFAAPVGQIFAALSMLALPYAARSYHERRAAGVERLSWRLTALYGGGAAIYWAVFFMLKQPAVHFLYAGRYTQVEYLLPLVALGSIFRIATVAQILSLKASQSPFLAFVSFIFADLVACLVGIPAIWMSGLQGALWTYLLSGASGLISGVILLRRTVRRASDEQLGSSLSTVSAPSKALGRNRNQLNPQSDVTNVG